MKLLTVTEKFTDYAEEVKKASRCRTRVEVDVRNEKIGYKIREARNERVSYFGVIGEKEMESGELTVRSSKKGELGSIPLDQFISDLQKEIADKAN